MSDISAGMHIIVRILKWVARVIGCYLLGFSTTYAAGWISKTPLGSPDTDLCEALLYRLNHTAPACIQVAVGAYQGFKSPSWANVDINKHLGLVDQLTGFNGWTRPHVFEWDLPVLKRSLQVDGTSLQIWRTRLLAYFDENSRQPTPPGSQTIALLSTKFDALSLADCPAYGALRQSKAFEVLPDLSTLDLHVTFGNASLLMHSSPVMYKGRVLFVSQYVGYLDAEHSKLDYGSEIVIRGNDSNSGAHPIVCSLWFDGNNEDSRKE